MSTTKAIDADVTAALDRWAAAIGTPDHQAASDALDAILVELCASRGREVYIDDVADAFNDVHRGYHMDHCRLGTTDSTGESYDCTCIVRELREKVLGALTEAQRAEVTTGVAPKDGSSEPARAEAARLLEGCAEYAEDEEWAQHALRVAKQLREDGSSEPATVTDEEIRRGVADYYEPDAASKRRHGVDPSWDFTAEKGSTQDVVRICAVLTGFVRGRTQPVERSSHPNSQGQG